MKNKLILISILLISAVIRFYNLDSIPSGIYFDEASQGYNAYSILKTGKDEYGEPFPIFLRSFGFYASSLYAYFSTIPILILGLSIFSTRLVSVLSGILLSFFTYQIIKNLDVKNNQVIALISSFVVAISPWSVLFSRGAFEANLALTIFVVAVYFLILSFKTKIYLSFASIILALSTYAYQSERVVALIFLTVFLTVFWKHYHQNKKIVVISLILFFVIQLPQLLLLSSAGAKIRFTQLSYLDFFARHTYSPMPFMNIIFMAFNIAKEFLSQYLAYFSPRNLFFDPDTQAVRSIPNLSVFYPWMVIPFFVGIKYLLSSKNDLLVRVLIMLALISPIPAAVVSDPFSTLRVLPFLWVLGIIISFGIYKCLVFIPKINFKMVLGIFFVILSLLHLYISYFVLLKHEGSKQWGYGYKLLVEKIKNIDKQIVIEDNEGPSYIEYVFLTQYDPKKLQEITDAKVAADYYNFVEFNKNIKIGNVEFRPIDYLEIEHTDQIIIVNPKAFSREDASSHRLQLISEVKDKRGEVLYTIYQTSPKKI